MADIVSDDPFDWPYIRFLDESQVMLVQVPESDLYEIIVKVCTKIHRREYV